MKTTSVIQDKIVSLMISIDTPDKLGRLRKMHQLLKEAGLYTIVMGYRKQPLIDPKYNPVGYTDRKVILIQSDSDNDDDDMSEVTSKSNNSKSPDKSITPKYLVIEEDDIFYWTHDMSRLSNLIYDMFHESLHRFVQRKDKEDSNGPEMYKTIISLVYGQRSIDVSRARKMIDMFRINTSKTFHEEYLRWEILFDSLDQALGKRVSSTDKLLFLGKIISSDPRPAIQSA